MGKKIGAAGAFQVHTPIVSTASSNSVRAAKSRRTTAGSSKQSSTRGFQDKNQAVAKVHVESTRDLNRLAGQKHQVVSSPKASLSKPKDSPISKKEPSKVVSSEVNLLLKDLNQIKQIDLDRGATLESAANTKRSIRIAGFCMGFLGTIGSMIAMGVMNNVAGGTAAMVMGGMAGFALGIVPGLIAGGILLLILAIVAKLAFARTVQQNQPNHAFVRTQNSLNQIWDQRETVEQCKEGLKTLNELKRELARDKSAQTTYPFGHITYGEIRGYSEYVPSRSTATMLRPNYHKWQTVPLTIDNLIVAMGIELKNAKDFRDVQKARDNPLLKKVETLNGMN